MTTHGDILRQIEDTPVEVSSAVILKLLNICDALNIRISELERKVGPAIERIGGQF